MNEKYFISIYGLFSSEDDIIRYIGQTKNSVTSRVREHLREAFLKECFHYRKSKWIRKVLSKGFQVQFIVLKENAIWNVDEVRITERHRKEGFDLTNLTDGGGGILNPSSETRKRIGKSSLGRVWSNESKARLSRLYLGKKRSKESAEKSGKARLGQKRNPEQRKRMSEACKGRIITVAQRQKISASLKRTLAKPELKKMLSERSRGHTMSLETRAKLRAGRLGRKMPPEFSEALKKAWIKRRLQ